MAEKNPSLWQIETIEKKPDQFFLRCVHNNLCKHWDNNGRDIEPNFITFSRNSDNYDFSVDWSKYSNAILTIIRKFLHRYIKKHDKSVLEALEDFKIPIMEELTYGISVGDLEIDEEVLEKSREKYNVLKIPIEPLINTIEEKGLPLALKHDPIREVSENVYFLNRSHSIISGFSKSNYTRIRVVISDIVEWVEEFEPIIN